MEWWLDGILQGRYTDIAFPVQSFAQFTISPTWGGIGGVKTESDYYWFDRVRVSGSIEPIASLTVDPASASLEVGQWIELTATLQDAEGNPLFDRVITWSSSAPSVAVVTQTGLVVGLAPGGPVTITATSEGHYATASITVTAPVGPAHHHRPRRARRCLPPPLTCSLPAGGAS
jgi:hypothetical protein